MKYSIMILLIVSFSTFLLGVEESKISLKGSSLGKYEKEGALVDITYTTQHVKKNEQCHINIILSPKINRGKLLVWMDIDKILEVTSPIERESEFSFDSINQTYSLNVTLSSNEEGIYYIRLLVELKGKMRSFAVPIYVDNIEKKGVSSSLKKTKSGQNIMVLPTIETIR